MLHVHLKIAVAAFVFLTAVPLWPSAQTSDSGQDCIRQYEALSEANRASTGGSDDPTVLAVRRIQLRRKPVVPSAGTESTNHLALDAIKERVSFQNLAEVRELEHMKEVRGLGYFKVFAAKLDGKKVFVKVSYLKPGEARAGMRKAEHFRNEAAWVRRLSEINIGPKFHGLSLYEGRQTIVSEFFDGIHFSGSVSQLPEDFVPTPQLIERLEHISRTLEKEGVLAKDLQLRINSTDAVVIDPEFFESASTVNDIVASQSELRSLIDHLRPLVAKPR